MQTEPRATRAIYTRWRKLCVTSLYIYICIYTAHVYVHNYIYLEVKNKQMSPMHNQAFALFTVLSYLE